MAYFTATYDLNEKKDYKKLIDELTRLKAHKCALSVWFLDLNWTLDQVRNHLSNFVDDDDFLIIVEFTKRPTFTRAIKGTSAWLDARF